MTQLTEHFTLAEAMKSDTAIRQGIDNTPGPLERERMIATAQAILEPARASFGLPVLIRSWYRSRLLNRAIGGVEKPGKVSQHVEGFAVDFEIPGVPNKELAEWVRDNCEYDQCILEFYDPTDPESGWVHASHVAGGCRAECLTVNAQGTFKGFL